MDEKPKRVPALTEPRQIAELINAFAESVKELAPGVYGVVVSNYAQAVIAEAVRPKFNDDAVVKAVLVNNLPPFTTQ